VNPSGLPIVSPPALNRAHKDVFTESKNRGAIALILGEFAKLRKATITFVISARPSVCPSQTTPFLLELF